MEPPWLDSELKGLIASNISTQMSRGLSLVVCTLVRHICKGIYFPSKLPNPWPFCPLWSTDKRTRSTIHQRQPAIDLLNIRFMLPPFVEQRDGPLNLMMYNRLNDPYEGDV